MINSFEQFYRVVSSEVQGRQPLACDAWLHDFPHFKLSVACLNSCELESHRSQDHRGLVSQEQAETLLNSWQKIAYHKWLKILVVHHNPIVSTKANLDGLIAAIADRPNADKEQILRFTSDMTGFEGSDLLKSIVRACRVHLVLHGHHHDQGDPIEWPWERDGRAGVLSVGSLGLIDRHLPGGAPPSCQLLWIHKADFDQSKRWTIDSYPLAYDGRFRLNNNLLEGNFVLDPAGRGRYSQPLQLDATNEITDMDGRASNERDLNAQWVEWEPESALPARGGLDARAVAFVRNYRHRMGSVFDRWDLSHTGVNPNRGGSRVHQAMLDEMYQPLRLAPSFDPNQTDLGTVMDLEQIDARFAEATARLYASTEWSATAPSRPKPFVISGPAGSGKTTWMQFTFRRLLEDQRFLPLMLVLRDLAKQWSDKECTGATRSIDAFLDGWILQHVGQGWDGSLRHLLRSVSLPVGPHVVLLVDGWDELGPFGHEFREKLLGFAAEYPHVLVIASSRPYGEGRPTSSDDYEALSIQPLSTPEIHEFVRRFFQLLYGATLGTNRSDADDFIDALNRAPEAARLAQNVMMLLMMLFLSRSERLPEKRHLLYERCLHNLLNAREQRGVLLSREQWRPSDNEVCMQVVASLAHSLQVKGFHGAERSQLQFTWELATEMLPQEWDSQQRHGFLDWLIGAAGVLIDRTDGTLVFSHLSFQEFLVAWHMDATILTSDAVAQQILEYVGDSRWTETLLLWSARISGKNRERFAQIMRFVIEAERGPALVGSTLAEGFGTTEMHVAWSDYFTEMIVAGDQIADIEALLHRWRISREETRRNLIIAKLDDTACKCGWQVWMRIETAVRLLGSKVGPPLPHNVAAAALVTATRSPNQAASGKSIAGGRILCSGAPLWPSEPSDLWLFQLWPCSRRHISLRLQNAIASGATLQQVLAGTVRELQLLNGKRQPVKLPRERIPTEINVELLNDVEAELGSYWSLMWPESTASWVTDWAGFWTPYWKYPRDQNATSSMAREWAQDIASNNRNAPTWSTGWAHESAQSWVKQWSLDECPMWLSDFARSEFLSLNRYLTRSFAKRIPQQTDLEQLFALACRISFENEPDARLIDGFDELLHEKGSRVDSMWISLARFLAGQCSNDDRSLLCDLAANPGKKESPLSWGLQYVVRGDLLLSDGTEVTLDQLCAQVGAPPLPYLDEIAR